MRTPDPSAPDAPLPRFWSSARRFPRACAVVAAVCAGAFCGIPLGFVGALTGFNRFGASVPLEAAHLPLRPVVATLAFLVAGGITGLQTGCPCAVLLRSDHGGHLLRGRAAPAPVRAALERLRSGVLGPDPETNRLARALVDPATALLDLAVGGAVLFGFFAALFHVLLLRAVRLDFVPETLLFGSLLALFALLLLAALLRLPRQRRRIRSFRWSYDRAAHPGPGRPGRPARDET
ncbi:hypothetical protein FOF52_03640 [Thermobifida alba]|uniref:Uncharacterized protein n=1 Tax=Thermobifida alba TaxID=53522 RepID=A0ABY4KXK8_THEAE|nr:hypothetical protein [Thermobifida alba]UPT20172.1 hypothetical protein FOF52_03640 [Thermobifida alba]